MPNTLTPVAMFPTGDAYRALPRTPEAWVVEHLIPSGGLFNMYGSPKSGKTWAALQLAIAVSSGEPEWLSFPVHTHGPVIYLQLDTPRSLWGLRLDTITDLGLMLDQVHLADSELVPYPFDILQAEKVLTSTGQLIHYPCQDCLRQQMEAIHPVLVIIDTLREVHRGDENDSGQMANVMSGLVAATRPAALCLLSHSRKDNLNIPEHDRENLLQDNRGSNYIAGRMDGIMRISTKRITYQSRTIDRHYLKCKRSEDGLWIIDSAEEDAIIRGILADPTLRSLADRASVLSERIGKSPEACRSLIRRRAERVAVEV